MKNFRNAVRSAAAAGALALAAGAAGAASDFPQQPIRIIVPYSAGGSTDVAARVLADGMSRQLKHTVIVENRPGAGGTIGTMAAVNAPADGYTLLITSSSHLVNKILQPDLKYDIRKDFVPLSQITRLPTALVVRSDYPAQSVAALIERGHKSSVPLTYGTAGVGTIQHVSASLFATEAKIDATHVPYKGGAEVVTDIIGGRIDFTFTPLVEVIGHIKSGRVKSLAVSTKERAAAIPDVPSVSETLKDYESFHWNGLVVKAGTPPERVALLADAIVKATKDPAVIDKLRGQGTEARGEGSQALAALMNSEQARLEPLLAADAVRKD
ncbi:tripartite tricarboxylate transporter substrate binding protein [Pigmentiphaga soli]|uniref:Tripartite tricarboxylate transporter substrate binding protein n=1 Tax=Pigmentiphaga soli TaxID=1007095 RepID=A0ABP8HQJ9_9BURK